ncbi:MAG: UDP-galactopyranose mutase, partial [Lachnospiraceae bacterium]|nr:UDP-galactopyranose mutase [Lachnospiraceae bacterium]
TSHDEKFTRIIEHKHFEFGKQPVTIITKEYPKQWEKGDEPYYPVNNERNNNLYNKYRELADKETNVFFGGRLGQYKYYDMDKVIAAALNDIKLYF